MGVRGCCRHGLNPSGTEAFLVTISEETHRKCKRCGEVRPLTQYYDQPGTTVSSRKKLECKECFKHRMRERQAQVCPWTGLTKKRAENIWRLYRLSAVQYKKMFDEQNGKCAICDEPMVEPHVDHDHSTEAIRQLLCGVCNVTLGVAKESSERLRSAAAYLERHNHV